MAGPLAGISAGQIAAQTAPDQAGPGGHSQGKFSQALERAGAQGVHGASGASPVGATHATHATRDVEPVRPVEQASEAPRSQLRKEPSPSTLGLMDPVTQTSEVSKSGSVMMGFISSMEQGQVAIEKLINGGLNGRSFSNTELLSLQAGMYKYTQELELTGKVVEKATTGLKDTLKTQV